MNIHFFRSGKSYYYVLGDLEYEVSDISINKLKEKLQLPFNVTFNGISIAQIQKICGRLKNDNVECLFGTDNGMISVKFYEIKRVVHAYLIPSKACLYGRSKNCKPYILNTLGDKAVLMEVTFDYACNNDGEFYFLYDELTKSEQDFFSPVYRELNVDYIYNIAHDKCNVLTRRKK